MSTNGYGDRQWNAWYGAMYYEDIMKYVQVCTCATSRVFTEPFWVKTMEYLTPRNFLPIKISGFCKIFWKPKIHATIPTFVCYPTTLDLMLRDDAANIVSYWKEYGTPNGCYTASHWPKSEPIFNLFRFLTQTSTISIYSDINAIKKGYCKANSTPKGERGHVSKTAGIH